MNIVCDICRTEFQARETYGENRCPQCGQLYSHDEGQQIVLRDSQLEALRQHYRVERAS